ncbi:hypothetical protein EXS74_03340 [Candidatus Woesearchaeota archaeon]|nr:hypothetical protein [Candidatus Woesearchaeota archaeon]
MKKNKFNRLGLLKKNLKLQDLPSGSQRKFLLVQIDGLSYSLLQKLRTTRYLPFTHGLLQNGYHVTKYDPGYPTTTPFIQAGILYNDNSTIPGFRFLDKKTQRSFNCGITSDARYLENELQEKNYGILRGGSSIGTIFCGDASRSILTVAHLYRTESGRKKIRDVIIVILLNPLQTLHVFLATVSEFFVELSESLRDFLRSILYWEHSNSPFFYPYFPFFRAFINAIAREISTQAGVLEMDRNSPYIYVTYGGYDWIAHYRGPESESGFHILKEIDADVRKLYKQAQKKGYDFYIYSDHGQIPSIPFEKLYYESFASFVQRISKLSARGFSGHDTEWNWNKYLYYKLEYYYDNISLPFRALAKGFSQLIKHTILKKKKDPAINWKNTEQIMLLYSSSLAHMYFNHSPEHLDLSDIEQKYPGFVLKLVQHPGVGFVIGTQGKNIEIIHAKGKVILKDKSVSFEGERFLRLYGDEEKLVRQLKYFAQIKYCGDLIINGAYDGKRIVAFESFHFGSHDSVGGKQNEAFFLSKDKINLDGVLNAKELYKIFYAYHQTKK